MDVVALVGEGLHCYCLGDHCSDARQAIYNNSSVIRRDIDNEMRLLVRGE